MQRRINEQVEGKKEKDKLVREVMIYSDRE